MALTKRRQSRGVRKSRRVKKVRQSRKGKRLSNIKSRKQGKTRRIKKGGQGDTEYAPQIKALQKLLDKATQKGSQQAISALSTQMKTLRRLQDRYTSNIHNAVSHPTHY
jgi:hypothetical protein